MARDCLLSRPIVALFLGVTTACFACQSGTEARSPQGGQGGGAPGQVGGSGAGGASGQGGTSQDARDASADAVTGDAAGATDGAGVTFDGASSAPDARADGAVATLDAPADRPDGAPVPVDGGADRADASSLALDAPRPTDVGPGAGVDMGDMGSFGATDGVVETSSDERFFEIDTHIGNVRFEAVAVCADVKVGDHVVFTAAVVRPCARLEFKNVRTNASCVVNCV